jgi:hypothetical protein
VEKNHHARGEHGEGHEPDRLKRDLMRKVDRGCDKNNAENIESLGHPGHGHTDARRYPWSKERHHILLRS